MKPWEKKKTPLCNFFHLSGLRVFPESTILVYMLGLRQLKSEHIKSLAYITRACQSYWESQLHAEQHSVCRRVNKNNYPIRAQEAPFVIILSGRTECYRRGFKMDFQCQDMSSGGIFPKIQTSDSCHREDSDTIV